MFGGGEWRFMTSVLSLKAQQGNVDSRLKRVYLQAPPCTKCVFGLLLILVILRHTARLKNVVWEMERGQEKRTEREKRKDEGKIKD
jgi:hypothetical protein